MKYSLRLAGLAALIVAAIAFVTPTHIELDIPVTKHQGGGNFWYERHRAELRIGDTSGALLAFRQVGTAYPDAQGWSSAEEILAFFDKELAARGWTIAAPGGNDYILPESRLLNPEQLRQCSRPGDTYPSSQTVLAVWPIGGGIVRGFHVALVTANPSLLYRIVKGFD